MLLPLHCLLELLILAFVKLHPLERLPLLHLHLRLMLVIERPQFPVFVLEEAGFIAILDHGFHEGHAEGHILIADAFDVELELFLNAVQLYL